jgi:hypothetical protein
MILANLAATLERSNLDLRFPAIKRRLAFSRSVGPKPNLMF